MCLRRRKQTHRQEKQRWSITGAVLAAMRNIIGDYKITGIGCLSYRHPFSLEICVAGIGCKFTGTGCPRCRHPFSLEICVAGIG